MQQHKWLSGSMNLIIHIESIDGNITLFHVGLGHSLSSQFAACLIISFTFYMVSQAGIQTQSKVNIAALCGAYSIPNASLLRVLCLNFLVKWTPLLVESDDVYSKIKSGSFLLKRIFRGCKYLIYNRAAGNVDLCGCDRARLIGSRKRRYIPNILQGSRSMEQGL